VPAMTSSRTSDTAADEEQAAGTKTEDADESGDEVTGESSESEPEAGGEGADAPTEAAADTDTDADTADTADTTDADKSAGDADKSAGGEPAETAGGGLSGVVAGVAAVVGAGLGLASLTGTWLSDVMSSRQELIGQINGQTATPEEQIATIYGSQWHTTALFNGFFALAAILVTAAALAIPAFGKNSGPSPTWVRAVAVGGLALGTIGLVIAAVMWFDVFTDLPVVPEMEQPTAPG
jgi:hypothetical protein